MVDHDPVVLRSVKKVFAFSFPVVAGASRLAARRWWSRLVVTTYTVSLLEVFSISSAPRLMAATPLEAKDD